MGFNEPAYRALCKDISSQIIANASRVNFEGEITTPEAARTITDAAERTGALGIGSVEIDKFLTRNSQARRLMPFDALWAAALCLGDITTTTPDGGTDSRQRLIVMDESTPDRLRTTVWEDSPQAGPLRFPGVGVLGLEVSVKRDDFCSFKSNWQGDGEAAVHAEDLSAVSVEDANEEWLKYGGVSAMLGGSYADGDVTGGTDYSDKLREGRAFVNTGAEAVYGFGNSDGFADSLRVANFRQLGLIGMDAVIEPEDETELDFFTGQTVQPFKLACQGAIIEAAIRYEVRICFPAAQIIAAPFASDRSIALQNLKIEALDNGTDPQVVIVIVNKTTSIFGS